MSDLAFFIEPTFWAGRRPCADDSNDIVLVGVGYGEEAPTVRKPEGDPARFADRVVGVNARDGQRIGERCRGLFEGDAVLPRFAVALRSSHVTRIDRFYDLIGHCSASSG
jgi:hypothetical protein